MINHIVRFINLAVRFATGPWGTLGLSARILG